MAYNVIIQCSDAEDIIKLLKKKHGADYARVWRIDGRTIGGFSFERSARITQAAYVNLITLDHDGTTENCEITIFGAGGSFPGLISIEELSDSLAWIVADLVDLAKERNWSIKAERAKIKSRGSPCPKCGAAYVYSEDKIEDDGSVACQNCGTRFIVQE
ncbi:MAG: MJ0042-type zinc finger domain-containing protein [Candidatus Thorarchaeota archaeon]